MLVICRRLIEESTQVCYARRTARGAGLWRGRSHAGLLILGAVDLACLRVRHNGLGGDKKGGTGTGELTCEEADPFHQLLVLV